MADGPVAQCSKGHGEYSFHTGCFACEAESVVREETTLAEVIRRIRLGEFYKDYDWATGPALRALDRAIDPATLAPVGAAPSDETLLRQYAEEAVQEAIEASAKWKPFNSAHEGFAVLQEEVEELWDHVKTNQKRRDLVAMRKEAMQVAAMGIRFMHDVCNEKVGRR